MFTKAWSAALLNAFGDILAQKVVDKNDRLDMKRLGIFTFLVQCSCTCLPESCIAGADGTLSSQRALHSALLTGGGRTWEPDPQAGTMCRVWSS